MPKYTLYIATYDRGQYPITGKTKPYHWLYFIQTEAQNGKRQGVVHQLRGMPGGFYYPGPEEVEDLTDFGASREILEVGEVDTMLMHRFHEIMRDVPINKVEHSGWNCQNWTLEGFENLREDGFVYGYLTVEALRTWLKED